jgi:uncharacterized protein YfiM (DUF2279 family)
MKQIQAIWNELFIPSENRLNISVIPPVPPLDAPTGLAVTAGNKTNGLAWNTVTSATGYKVYRSTSTGTETFLANSATNSYTDNAVTNGTQYFYKVTATGTSPESAKSSEAHGTPVLPAPNGLTVTPGDTVNDLAWTTVTNATGYKIYRSLTTGTETLLTTSATNSFHDTGLTNSTEYFYKVTATDATSESVKSSEANGTPAPAGPTVVTLRPYIDYYPGMTPSAGTDCFAMINEAVADDAATTVNNVGGSGLVLAVGVHSPSVPTGATAISLRIFGRAYNGLFMFVASFGGGAHTLNGTMNSIGYTWTDFSDTFTTCPWTGNPWTVDDINALDSINTMSSKLNGDPTLVTQEFLQVTYTP